MTTRVLKSDADRRALFELLASRKLPVTVEIRKGVLRTTEQNRTQRLWLKEASQQLADETPEQKRAYCKLHFGVPILREESEFFREKYDRIIKPLPYEQKLELMMEPFDFPVTRLMTTRQKKDYLDMVWEHFTALGAQLSNPDERRRAA